MSGSPSLPLQAAIYSRLGGDATLTTTLGSAVYDEVPTANIPEHYVTIGEDTEAPNDTMGKTGRDLTVTIHAWSRAKGSKKCKQIMSRVDELLDRWTPTVTGWSATEMLLEFSEGPFRDPDGLTRHGVRRYRIHIKAS